jgi:hypothetical protein
MRCLLYKISQQFTIMSTTHTRILLYTVTIKITMTKEAEEKAVHID